MAQLGSNTSGHLFDTSFTADGVLYADASGVITSTAVGTATHVLTSNGTGVAPTFQAAGGGGGSATGFFAYASSAKTNVTGNTVIYTVLFDSTTRNDGTAYATGTGLYTAPSTGLYHFSTTIIFTSGSTFTAGSELVVSSIGSVSSQILEQVGAATSAIGSTTQILSNSWELQMTAGDTVGVRVLSTSTLQDVSIGGSAISPNQFTAISSFSGFKVGT